MYIVAGARRLLAASSDGEGGITSDREGGDGAKKHRDILDAGSCYDLRWLQLGLLSSLVSAVEVGVFIRPRRDEAVSREGFPKSFQRF